MRTSLAAQPKLRQRRPQTDAQWRDTLDDVARHLGVGVIAQDEQGSKSVPWRVNRKTNAMEWWDGKNWSKITGGGTTQITRETVYVTSAGAVVPLAHHNLLVGLDGGSVVPLEYYHLKRSDWSALTDANAQLAALQTDGAPAFAGATIGALAGYVKATAGVLSAGAISLADLPTIFAVAVKDLVADTPAYDMEIALSATRVAALDGRVLREGAGYDFTWSGTTATLLAENVPHESGGWIMAFGVLA